MTSPAPDAAPAFTVVIPTFGRPALLPHAVASVLGQTITDFEVLVVDDASPEAPAPIPDPRVRVIVRATKGGPAACRNTGAQAACGRYLTFLDDDDLWAPHRLELALAGLARAPVALCWTRYLDELPAAPRQLDGDVRDVILDEATPSLDGTALDRDRFVPFDESFAGREDLDWWLRLSRDADFATVPEFGALRRRPAAPRNALGDEAQLAADLRLLDRDAEWFATHPHAAAHRWHGVGVAAARQGDVALARRAFARSWRAQPAALSLAPLAHLARSVIPVRPPTPCVAADGSGPALRILQVITDTDRRGAQVFAHDLGAALTTRGHEVRTVALAPGASETRLEVDTLGPTRLAPATLRALRAAAADHDVVVAHGSSTLPACAIALTGDRRPFVYRQISDSLFWAPTPAKRLRVRAFLGRAAHVVALSNAQAEVLHEHFGVGPEAVTVIPNGVPAANFAPAPPADRAAARARFGVPDDAFVVLSISALVPEKGVDRVLAATAGLGDGACVLVAGDGAERSHLEAAAAALGLGERARFTGSLTDPREAYAAADVVVLASRGGDSMPATLVEAGFCAVPAIGTPVGAITEIVIDGVTGVVVPIDDPGALLDALVALRDAPSDRERLGAGARAHCLEHFEIAVVADRWDAALVAAAGHAVTV